MVSQLEHVNVTVTDAQAVANRLVDLFDWKIRWHGPAKDNGYTYHVGTDEKYLAVYSPPIDATHRRDGYTAAGHLNHIGIVVDDLLAMKKRVVEAGFEPFNHAAYEPGERFYFNDNDGIEFEVVSYN